MLTCSRAEWWLAARRKGCSTDTRAATGNVYGSGRRWKTTIHSGSAMRVCLHVRAGISPCKWGCGRTWLGREQHQWHPKHAARHHAQMCKLTASTHTHAHTRLFCLMPPHIIPTHTHDDSGSDWIRSKRLGVHQSACMPAPTKLSPSPFAPALPVSTTSSSCTSSFFTKTTHPTCSPSTLLSLRPRWWLSIGPGGTYGLVRRLLHGDGSSRARISSPHLSLLLPPRPPFPPSRLVRTCPPPLAAKHLDAGTGPRIYEDKCAEAHLSSSEMSMLISSLVILREIKKTQREIHSCLTGFHL